MIAYRITGEVVTVGAAGYWPEAPTLRERVAAWLRRMLG